MLEPRYQASAQLTGSTGGAMVLQAGDLALSLRLLPFFKGDPGSAAAISSDANNQLTNGTDLGLYVPDMRYTGSDLPDFTLIFDNQLI